MSYACGLLRLSHMDLLNFRERLSIHGAGSFKVIKYHGSSRDAALLAVKRGEYEVGRCDLSSCKMMHCITMYAEWVCSAIAASHELVEDQRDAPCAGDGHDI